MARDKIFLAICRADTVAPAGDPADGTGIEPIDDGLLVGLRAGRVQLRRGVGIRQTLPVAGVVLIVEVGELLDRGGPSAFDSLIAVFAGPGRLAVFQVGLGVELYKGFFKQ